MDFRSDRKSFVGALSKAHEATARQSSLTVLMGVHIITGDTRVFITGLDLEVGITTEVAAVISDNGKVLVPSKLLLDTVKAMEGAEVHLSEKAGKLIIESGGSKTTLTLMDANEFPVFPQRPASFNGYKEIEFSTLEKKLSKLIFCTSTKPERPELGAVFFGEEEMAATDGARCSVVLGGIPGLSGLLPAKSLQKMLKAFDHGDQIRIGVMENNSSRVLFFSDDAICQITMIDGQFPPYKNIMPPEYGVKATGLTKDVQLASRQLSTLGKGGEWGLPVYINGNQKKGTITFMAKLDEVGSSQLTVEAELDGNFVFTVQGSFLKEVFNAMDGEKFSIGFNAKNRPIQFIQADDEFFNHVIMPLSVGNEPEPVELPEIPAEVAAEVTAE